MKYFTTIHDVKSPEALIQSALQLKQNPFGLKTYGKNKTLGLLFFNPSTRTRLSMQKAARNLGMDVIIINVGQDSWSVECEDGAIMNGSKPEHIKDLAAMLSIYCDILGVRVFSSLTNRQTDYNEKILLSFMRYCKIPVISLESATRHPLQSLADVMTILEHNSKPKPKVVLSWAPHIKPLPQAVANSFCEWIPCLNAEFVITNPPGYDLSPEFTKGFNINHNQSEALQDADFVYLKNWSAFENYGAMPEVNDDWLFTMKKWQLTHHAKVMHCLPVRRNVEVPDEILDGEMSLIHQQAENRIYSAQVVLSELLGVDQIISMQTVNKNENEKEFMAC